MPDIVSGYNYVRESLYKTPRPRGQSSFAPHIDKAKPKSDEPTVRTPSLAYQAMAATWADIDVIRGGTKVIRDAGELYLPQEPGEGNDAYSRRTHRATLAPLYVWLVRAFAAMILRKPIKVLNTGNLPETDFRAISGYHPGDDEAGEPVIGHLEDVGREGSSLQQFAFEWLCEAIHYGHALVEVIYPAADVQTRADEVGLRPHWSIYPAPKMLGHRKQGLQLSRVRLLQHPLEPVGEWGERHVDQVMVYRLEGEAVTWETWRESEQKEDEWLLFEQGDIDLNGLAELPVVVLYSDRKGHQVPPPMSEVAHLNIRHYQVSADIDHNCHVAAVPRLMIFGATPEELGEIGSVDEAVCIPNPESRAEWSAAGIEAFEPNNQRLEQLEMQMIRLGVGAMTHQKNVGESADAKRLDRTQGDSQLAVLAQNLQAALNASLRLHCAFLGHPPEQAPTVEVSRDFDVSQLDPPMLQALTSVVNAGKLSTETFLGLLKQGEIGLPDEWTPEVEIERLDSELQQQTTAPVQPNGLTNPLDALQ